MCRCVTDVYNVKTQMNLSIHAFSQALCVLTLRFQRLFKKKKILLFPYVINSNKNVKKKYIGYDGIRTHSLEFLDLQLALEKALKKGHLTPELSGPINVKD